MGGLQRGLRWSVAVTGKRPQRREHAHLDIGLALALLPAPSLSLSPGIKRDGDLFTGKQTKVLILHFQKKKKNTLTA